MQKDGSVRIDFSTLLADVDGDVLDLSSTNPAHGTLTRNNDGSYTYRPASGYTGTDGFSYMIYDGELATTAHVTLNVIAGVPTTNGSINWSGSGTPANSLANLSLPPHEEWIANFLGATQVQRSLADMTGLVVTMNP